MPLTLTLVRKTLTNVDDAAGRWQYEGGDVLLAGRPAGQYASHKRVVTGVTDVQNVAMLTLTFFLEKGPNGIAENITLQGIHDFTSGKETGSVSAASIVYYPLIGKHFSRVLDIVAIS